MTVGSLVSSTASVEPGYKTGLLRLMRNRRILSLVDQALLSAVNMCTTVIIGRTCAKQQLGLYASGYSLVLFLTAVQTALISVPYTISSPRLKGEAHRVYKGSTLLQQAALSTVGMLCFLFFGLFASPASRTQGLDKILLVLAIYAGLMCFRDFARRTSYAELNFDFALIIDGLMAAVQLGGIVTLAMIGTLTAARALGIVGLATGIAGALWLVTSWKSLRFSWKHSFVDFRQNWAFGRWLLASSVLWSICIDQYPWMLTALRGSSEAAVWASCYGVMAFLNPCVLALNNDAAPRVANDYASGGLVGLRKSVFRSAAIAALITLPLVFGLLVFGDRLVKLMYGGKFAGAGGLVAILTIGFWLYAFGLAFPYGMLALKRPGLDFSINVLCFVAFLTGGVSMIRSYGALGAACSFLMVQSVAFGSRILGFRIATRAAMRKAAA